MGETETTEYFPNELAHFTYLRTYARWVPELGRREKYPETVKRVTDFFRKVVGDKLPPQVVDDIHDAIISMRVMPSMRLMAMAGPAVEASNVAAFNCAYTPIDSLQGLCDIFFVLLNGCGAGYSVERRYTEKLPVVAVPVDGPVPLYIIEDSAEGWCHALGAGLDAWYAGRDIEFDYSLVRPAGAPLHTKGGRASGPGPLKELLVFVRETIRAAAGRKLRPIELSDLANAVAAGVVVGGVRRSSEISLSDLDDEEMRDAKVGAFWNEHQNRSMSNNSAVYTEKPDYDTFSKEFDALIASGTGERGIFSRDAANRMKPSWRKEWDFGTNPCFAPGTLIMTEDDSAVPIEHLVGKEVTIWNGDSSQTVDNFRVTATNQPLLKITMEDGSFVRVTPYHSVILEDKSRIQAQDLMPGTRLWYSPPPSRYRSGDLFNGVNIVQSVESDGVAEKVYCCTVDGAHSVTLSSGVVFGQCGEINLRGRQFCNLSSIIARPEDTKETLTEKMRIAAIIGTIQSSLTNFPYLGPEWKANCDEEALLGISVTGQLSCPAFYQHPETMEHMRDTAVQANREYARLLGVNASASLTCVKPEGTCGLVTGTSAGLHPWFSQWFLRRVRVSASDPLCKLLRNAKVPHQPEVGQKVRTANTFVFEFPCKAPDGAITRDMLTALDQLEQWKRVKLHYTHHNPSATIYVKNEEWASVKSWVFENFDCIGGLSFLPSTDHVYELAPYTDLTEEEYNTLIAQFPVVNWERLGRFEKEDRTTAAQEVACAGGACELP